MVVGEASIHNIMGGMESTGGVRLHNHKRKLKQRFDIIKKLGQGTYGKVQLGINKETGQEVAIKTIKKCKIETEADLIRIRREIQIMSSVQHPNIIHIYEVFENREKMVLVMEYAAGGELYDYLSERKVLNEQEARRIFRQIATAVFYCHKHKICHRDLKLENILLDQVGNAKIADFGLSNVFDEQRLLSTFCGSPLYASPEIVRGTPYHGPEVDCWSLGVLLYTLVYGAMPFDGSNFKRLVKQISQSDYFEPKKPSPASPLIKDMLTVCPSRRADIEKICTHWWVNEGYEQNCLDIAEDLAAQTPVRLDLLLSIVPQSASAEKLLVGDQRASGDVANSMSTETLVPTRCHSVGSLMELDQNNSDRRIRELFEEEPKTAPISDAKRKLETTPSMEETAAADVKRTERSRRKERTAPRDSRIYTSMSRHHSAPIPNSIIEEAMDVDPTMSAVNVPTVKTSVNVVNDVGTAGTAAACLELIEECREKSPMAVNDSKQINSLETKEPDIESEKIKVDQKQVAIDSPKLIQSLSEVQPNDDKSPTEPTSTPIELETRPNDNSKSIVPNKESGPKIDNIIPTSPVNVNVIGKKLKDKALSLDSELSNEPAEPPLKPTERRRSKIFETAEKFNQMASNNVESEKPKKIFIPGVNVGGAKRAFERKASLSSINVPPLPVKAPTSKVIIDVPVVDKKTADDNTKPNQENNALDLEEKAKRDEAKKRAVDIITGAIGKPPVQRRINGSPPISPQTQDPKKVGLKIQVAPNDVRNATVSVSTPIDTKFSFESKSSLSKEPTISSSIILSEPTTSIENNESLEEPKMSSKMEITLKSATLPRPRKTSKAEITLSGIKPPETPAFKSEVEAKIEAFSPQKLKTQRSEIAFPVAAVVSHSVRSSSLEPENSKSKTLPKERIIPIQVEPGHQQRQHSSTPPPQSKPPMPQRSMSQRSSSLSRQSTADSDTDSALGSTSGPEPIRKSPREYIIPIAVEGGGYVTPRSGSVEPESKTSTPTSTNPSRSRFGRPRRMGSLLSDASEDESPFSSLHRDSEDLLQRHMHRLRSTRPSRQPSEHADSLSSGEDDDDDGFELLTAENLFSTLLSRVRSLTQRLNVDDGRGSGFPNSRLLGRLGTNSSDFWGINKPVPWRTESQFKRSTKRGQDAFDRRDSLSSTNSGTMNSPGSRNASSRENVFEMGSNTLPRDRIEHEDTEAEKTAELIRKEAQESLEQNFTPSLARRLSRHLIEQSRKSLPRSLSIPREKYYHSPTRENLSLIEDSIENNNKHYTSSTTSDQTEYRGSRSNDRHVIRRTNSLLEPSNNLSSRHHHRSPRRSISLFDEDDRLPPPTPRQVMTLGRKYKDPGVRRENFYPYRTEKIQEESLDESALPHTNLKDPNELIDSIIDNGSTSECTSISMCNSNTELLDTVSSVSARSYETSPTESSSNIVDCSKSYKSDISRNFENRLLAAENLIKESKLKNLGPPKFNPNLNSNYKEFDKCDKEEILSSMTDATNILKRRSCIPSLRLRSASLTRDSENRRKSFSIAGSQTDLARAVTPERSILSKLFRSGGSSSGGGSGSGNNSGGGKENETNKAQKPKQRRISRFLRPDFFDTPREESQYVKEKEAQKAAENERRKSRFMKKKSEKLAAQQSKDKKMEEEKLEKELKNEMNSLKKDQSESSTTEDNNNASTSSSKIERQSSKSNFFQSLEKKLEKFQQKSNGVPPATMTMMMMENKTARDLRENSAPPTDDCQPASNLIKKAISVEDLTAVKKHTSKSKVSSVLGLFRSDPKPMKSQNLILSKLKKSPSKSTKSDSSLIEDRDSPSTSGGSSKIPTKSSSSKSANKKSPEKSIIVESKKSSPPKDKKPDDKTSPDTSESIRKATAPASGKIDNKQVEDKKLLKTKKNINTLGKTGGSSSHDGGASNTAPTEDSEKKVKRVVVKTKTDADKEETDSSKRKKIVRVVKRVVKKSSDNSDSKTEEKDKSTPKGGVSKKTGNVTLRKEDGQKSKRSSKEKSPTDGGVGGGAGKKSNSSDIKSKTDMINLSKQSLSKSDSGGSNAVRETNHKPIEKRGSRSNLKLDLSKIPQHTFRNSNKKDSPSKTVQSPSESLKNESEDHQLTDSPSKMTHHANITGNKIIIDKPLKVKDVEELKKGIIKGSTTKPENHVPEFSPGEEPPGINLIIEPNDDEMKKYEKAGSASNEIITDDANREIIHHREELFSPMEETESFDSWSLCSADMNRARGELHSPTSPSSYLPLGDQPESVIDRIRRRSFYSRFNDRKRASLNAPPPGITTSTTLPRKFSFSSSSSRDKDRKLMSNYKKHTDRAYNDLYDDGSYRRSPIDPLSPYGDRTKSPTLEYSNSLTSYDNNNTPLRRYLRSPTIELDLSNSRRKYHSTDFSSDTELGSSSYRGPYSTTNYNDLPSPVALDVTPRSSSCSSNSKTLPRKYGSSLDSKSIEYFEELLAPSNPEYMLTRTKSPLSSGEHPGRCENGYPNGNLDEKRNSHSDEMLELDQELLTRNTNQQLSEIRDIPSTSSELQ